MDDSALFEETIRQRTGLVEVLGGLSEAEWDKPSLCAGWRIREVVAHITMPYRHSGRTILIASLAKTRLNVRRRSCLSHCGGTSTTGGSHLAAVSSALSATM